MIDKYGRKFFMAMVVILLGFYFRAFDKLTGGELITLVGLTYGMFTGANYLQKKEEIKNGKTNLE